MATETVERELSVESVLGNGAEPEESTILTISDDEGRTETVDIGKLKQKKPFRRAFKAAFDMPLLDFLARPDVNTDDMLDALGFVAWWLRGAVEGDREWYDDNIQTDDIGFFIGLINQMNLPEQ